LTQVKVEASWGPCLHIHNFSLYVCIEQGVVYCRNTVYMCTVANHMVKGCGRKRFLCSWK